MLPVIVGGKPFFHEWPAGRNTDETREIATAAHTRGGLQGRSSPTVKKVKEIIASGRIGPVHSVTVVHLLYFVAGAP